MATGGTAGAGVAAGACGADADLVTLGAAAARPRGTESAVVPVAMLGRTPCGSGALGPGTITVVDGRGMRLPRPGVVVTTAPGSLARPRVVRPRAPPSPPGLRVPAPGRGASVEDAPTESSGSAMATAVLPAIAAPTPSAAASTPTRPMYPA